LASLALLQEPANIRARQKLQDTLSTTTAALWKLEAVGDVRQVGLMVGIELVKDWRIRAPYALEEQVGIRVAQAMARRGVLTRPIGNILVLMPPYCTTQKQVEHMVLAMADSILEVCG
jgi:adenosylmethionine-8-amino-7-oxononanoate aminotransferase